MATRKSIPTVITINTSNIYAGNCASMMLENLGDTAFDLVIGGVKIPFAVGRPAYVFEESQSCVKRGDNISIEFTSPIGTNPLAVLWRDVEN